MVAQIFGGLGAGGQETGPRIELELVATPNQSGLTDVTATMARIGRRPTKVLTFGMSDDGPILLQKGTLFTQKPTTVTVMKNTDFVPSLTVISYNLRGANAQIEAGEVFDGWDRPANFWVRQRITGRA